jgi:hypothetical protein
MFGVEKSEFGQALTDKELAEIKPRTKESIESLWQALKADATERLK